MGESGQKEEKSPAICETCGRRIRGSLTGRACGHKIPLACRLPKWWNW